MVGILILTIFCFNYIWNIYIGSIPIYSTINFKLDNMEDYLLPLLIGMASAIITYLALEVLNYCKQSKYVNNTTGDMYILLGVNKSYKSIDNNNVVSCIYVLESSRDTSIELVNDVDLNDLYHKVK